MKQGDGLSTLNTQSHISSQISQIDSNKKGSPENDNIFIKNLENFQAKTHCDSMMASTSNTNSNPFIELCGGFNPVDVDVVRNNF